MRLKVSIAICAVFGLVGLSGSASAASVQVECPKNWPDKTGSDLREHILFVDGQMQLSTDVTVKGEIYHELLGGADDTWAELGCTYGDGTRLFIPIPQGRTICHSIYRYQERPKEVTTPIRDYCTFTPSGDPARDKVEILVAEPLTAAVEFYGTHLGMTPEEAGAAVREKLLAPPVRSGTMLISDVEADRRIALVIDEVSGRIGKIIIYPRGDARLDVYTQMKRRFGLPESSYYFSAAGNVYRLWKAKDGTRLEVQSGDPKAGVQAQVRLIAAPVK